MQNKSVIPKILTISGTLLTWSPIAFTVVTSLIRTQSSGTARFDYLMLAELFPLALGGALFLLWASLRTHFYTNSIIIGTSVACVSLIGGQALAVKSGLASGAAKPEGLVWAAVLASIAIYSLAVVELGIAGIMLAKKLFGPRNKTD